MFRTQLDKHLRNTNGEGGAKAKLAPGNATNDWNLCESQLLKVNLLGDIVRKDRNLRHA